uniref:Uncharacterized protein n=1 Tax=Anguilla anguilla TaxID=7936 RepID=A0A0E9XKT1_ANGAN
MHSFKDTVIQYQYVKEFQVNPPLDCICITFSFERNVHSFLNCVGC